MPANDLEFRYGVNAPTLRLGETDRCRPLTATIARARALLAEAVREAGALALRMFRTELRHWIKGETSPVSEADIAVDDLLKARLIGDTPDHGWLSEESADDDGAARPPADGWSIRSTARAPIIAGREDWSLSVALVADGRPVAGAVFAPAT